MAVPWLQIVRLVPSILDVSRELLKRTKRAPAMGLADSVTANDGTLATRLDALEENERRQAELVSQMAEQNAALARAVTTLHTRTIRLSIATGIALLLAAVALAFALSK